MKYISISSMISLIYLSNEQAKKNYEYFFIEYYTYIPICTSNNGLFLALILLLRIGFDKHTNSMATGSTSSNHSVTSSLSNQTICGMSNQTNASSTKRMTQ